MILKITWYTFGTVFVKSVPKLYQNCTYVDVMMLHFWCSFGEKCTKSVPKVYLCCSFGAVLDKNVPKFYSWSSFGTVLVQFCQKCTKSVLAILHFWYTFGTLFPKTAPKLQHPYSNTSAVLVQFWYSFGQKCTKSVLDRSMLPTLIAALVGTIRSFLSGSELP